MAITFCLVGCEEKNVCRDKTETAALTRFTHLDVGSNTDGVFLIRDNQTGKEYLAVSYSGLVEVEPTKP